MASKPRPTGTAAAAEARELCARELRGLGFEVEEQRFLFSEFPGRFATPLFGFLGLVLFALTVVRALDENRVTPLITMMVGVAVLAYAARMFARRGVLEMPFMRAAGANLEAVQPGDAPKVWLCAHVDSKSQPIPSLARAGGIVLEATGLVMATVLAALQAAGRAPHEIFWGFAAAVTLLGAIPVMLSMVGTSSPGALDNASGVATVLSAARRLGGARGVGVLITDAEEFGLAGARHWSIGRGSATVINCDGVDDGGSIAVMRSGPIPKALTNALRSAGPVEIGRHFPGVLTDAVAFSDAGMSAVTVSKGTALSFLRVHSRFDNLERLRGEGIEPTAEFIARTAQALLTSEVK